MARTARKDVYDKEEVGTYHCSSRVVRRAFLCGYDEYSQTDYNHRKRWIDDLLRFMACYFAIDQISHSIMSNHLHNQLRNRPDIARKLPDKTVAYNWLMLHPHKREKDGTPCEPTDEQIAEITGNKKKLELLRERLSDISWFMKYLKERIARRANKEDEARGHFFEARFTMTKLLDEPAALVCSVYIDLNPVRAGAAATPETSEHTSFYDRVQAYQDQKLQRRKKPPRQTIPADAYLSPLYTRKLPAELCYAQEKYRASDDAGLAISFEEYAQLVDWTGRQLRSDKRGAIAAEEPPILERLHINSETWVEAMSHFEDWFHNFVGGAEAMAQVALDKGQKWLQGLRRCRQLFGANERSA